MRLLFPCNDGTRPPTSGNATCTCLHDGYYSQLCQRKEQQESAGKVNTKGLRRGCHSVTCTLHGQALMKNNYNLLHFSFFFSTSNPLKLYKLSEVLQSSFYFKYLSFHNRLLNYTQICNYMHQ